MDTAMNIAFIKYLSECRAYLRELARVRNYILRVWCPRDRGVSVPSPPPGAIVAIIVAVIPELSRCIPAGAFLHLPEKDGKKAAAAMASSNGESR